MPQPPQHRKRKPMKAKPPAPESDVRTVIIAASGLGFGAGALLLPKPLSKPVVTALASASRLVDFASAGGAALGVGADAAGAGAEAAGVGATGAGAGGGGGGAAGGGANRPSTCAAGIQFGAPSGQTMSL